MTFDMMLSGMWLLYSVPKLCVTTGMITIDTNSTCKFLTDYSCKQPRSHSSPSFSCRIQALKSLLQYFPRISIRLLVKIHSLAIYVIKFLFDIMNIYCML